MIISLFKKPTFLRECVCENRTKDIRITNCSHFPNGSSASNNSSCVCVCVCRGVRHKYPSVITTLFSPCREGVSISISYTLFIFVYLRNTMTSLPRTRRGFSAYACKVRLTHEHLQKRRPRVFGPVVQYARDPAKTLEDGAMSALTVFRGRPVSVTVVKEGEEERSVSVF
jgi:hypothetical protein